MNVHNQLELELPISQPLPVVTTEQIRLALLNLARQHATIARHYRAAACDLDRAQSFEVTI